MAELDKEQRFFLTFQSVDEFERVMEGIGPSGGIFFKSTRPLSAGKQVSIVTRIKGIADPVFLRGVIVSRRVRTGGPNLPAGVYVRLTDRDRARIGRVVRYLKSAKIRMQRIHPRYPLTIPAKYSTSEGEIESCTLNISQGGVFLHTTGPLLTTGARFSLVLYPKGEEGKPLRVDARVAWIDYFESTKGMGVAFTSGQGRLKRIQRLISGYEKRLNV